MIRKLDKYAVFVLLGSATISPDDWCLAFQESMMVSCSRWDFMLCFLFTTYEYISVTDTLLVI